MDLKTSLRERGGGYKGEFLMGELERGRSFRGGKSIRGTSVSPCKQVLREEKLRSRGSIRKISSNGGRILRK